MYTYRLLSTLMKRHGVEEVDVDNAEALLVSVDDPDDLGMVRRASRAAKGRPLVAGGFEGFVGEYLLAWVDAINVGEGFEFFEALGKVKDIRDLYSKPYMLTRNKVRVIPSTFIDPEILPLVKTSKGTYYYLAGRGCAKKCAFCLTSYAMPHWNNDSGRINLVTRHVENIRPRAKLTLITNDSQELLAVTPVRNAQSLRVMDYLRTPHFFKFAKMIHFGIEGFTEERRKAFGKPISNEAIYRLIHTLIGHNQQAELFFIHGLPGTFEEMLEFAEGVPLSTKVYPRLMVKLTRLETPSHTPMWTMDLRSLEELTNDMVEKFRRALVARNHTFRIFPVRGDAKAVWRCLLRRSNPGDAIRVGPEPPGDTSVEEYMQSTEDKGLEHLLTYDGRPMPNSQIVTPWRKTRDAVAKGWGLAPVTYKSP